MRKPVMAGNWKMYKTAADTVVFLERFLPLVAGSTHCEIVICPPFTNLVPAAQAVSGSRVAIGAQNIYGAKEGAFTGEVSAGMISGAGATYVIVGHSERRQYFGETDEMVFKKTVAAIEGGLNPIVCVGERLEEREAGATGRVLEQQFQKGLGNLAPELFAKIVIAYEPVWAIGTGKTATPDIAAAAHQLIRGEAEKRFGAELAGSVRILYGGSVKPDNIKDLMSQREIDGALVGGASLDAATFASIVNF
ncbi:MAG: triose-phosphate isomerase [Bryobacteraceae bacterium]